MSDSLPDRIPEHMSDRMPEYMPDRVPEYMWDKLPEYIYIYRIYVQIYILKCHGGDYSK